MDNGKWIMDNEGVAFGDIFQIISEENTTIIHYPLSIIHYPFGHLPDKRELSGYKPFVVSGVKREIQQKENAFCPIPTVDFSWKLFYIEYRYIYFKEEQL